MEAPRSKGGILGKVEKTCGSTTAPVRDGGFGHARVVRGGVNMDWGVWTDDQVRQVAAVLPRSTQETDDHAPPWKHRSWQALLPDCMEEVPENVLELDRLPRRAIFDVARAVFRGDATARVLLLLTVAWGKGSDVCGPCVAFEALSTDGADEKLEQVVGAMSENRVLDAYSLLASECRLREIGPSFGTKFLYFLGARSDVEPMPLILDSIVGARLDGFGVHFRYRKWQVDDYSSYLSFMAAVGKEIDLAPDDIELRLFAG